MPRPAPPVARWFLSSSSSFFGHAPAAASDGTAARGTPVRLAGLALVALVASGPAVGAPGDPRAPGAPVVDDASDADVDDARRGDGAHTAADDDDAPPEPPAERRAVVLLPLGGEGSVTTKQAKGVAAQVRAAVEVLVAEGAVRLLPATRADDGVLRRCAADVACYEDLARERGADVLARGRVVAGEGGLVVQLDVVPGNRPLATTLAGGADDAARLDRLVREAFAPDTLRGSLRIAGMAGDTVTLDGRRRGSLDAEGGRTFPRLREGRHNVQVARPPSKNGTAYEPFEREIDIRHGEETALKVTLLPRATTATLDGDANGATTASLPVPALVTTAAGGAFLVGGVVFGVLSVLDATEVERRARDQQLVFPRDEELVTRGTTYAVVADVLYGVGVAAAGAGVALWVFGSAPADDEEAR